MISNRLRGRRSDCVAGSVPGNQSCLSEGRQRYYEAQPHRFRLLQDSIHPSVCSDEGHDTAYKQLYVLQYQPFVVLSWHVSAHLTGKNFSAASDETSKRRFQLEGVQRSLLTKTVLDAVCFVAIFQYFYYRLSMYFHNAACSMGMPAGGGKAKTENV